MFSFNVSRFEYAYDEVQPTKPLTGIERLASRLVPELSADEHLILRQWAAVVLSGNLHALLKASIPTRKAYARVVSVYYRHGAFTGTLATLRVYDGVIESYHQRGLGVCQVHDDLAVIVTDMLK